MPVFVLAVAIVLVLLANLKLGGSNQGCLVQLALWFAVGVLLGPVLGILSCFWWP